VFKPDNVDFLLCSKRCLLERYGEIITQIRTRLRTAAATTMLSCGKTEKIFKKVAERTEDVFCTTEAPETGTFNTCMTVEIIQSALLRVAQHIIGLGSFLEFFLRLLVIRITVRMILQGKLAIGLFDFLL
jgi:hypothetical protein